MVAKHDLHNDIAVGMPTGIEAVLKAHLDEEHRPWLLGKNPSPEISPQLVIQSQWPTLTQRHTWTYEHAHVTIRRGHEFDREQTE